MGANVLSKDGVPWTCSVPWDGLLFEFDSLENILFGGVDNGRNWGSG